MLSGLFKLDPKPKVSYCDDNKVCLYVWKSTSKGIPGHASIEVFGHNPLYVSWWPNFRTGDRYSHPKSSYLSNTHAYEGRTYEQDFKAEGERGHDYEIVFYSLDKEKIRSAFNKIKTEARWHMLGGSSFFLKFAEVQFHSCCSMAAYLLQEGGGICENFYNTCANTAILKAGSIDPEHLARNAHVYERWERRKYQYVAVGKEDETAAEYEKPACLIM